MMMKRSLALGTLLIASLLISACASSARPASTRPGTATAPRTPTRTPPRTRPVVRPPVPPYATSAPGSARGLEEVLGQNARALARMFGEPRLEIFEGDAMKLQWTGSACILDAYLLPPAAGRDPVATHIDARRSDGQAVDRASCISALRQ